MLTALILLSLFTMLVMCTKIETGPGDACSRIYGVAYWKIAERRCVCYPIPFNIIAFLLNRLWWKLVHPEFIINSISKLRSEYRNINGDS